MKKLILLAVLFAPVVSAQSVEQRLDDLEWDMIEREAAQAAQTDEIGRFLKAQEALRSNPGARQTTCETKYDYLGNPITTCTTW